MLRYSNADLKKLKHCRVAAISARSSPAKHLPRSSLRAESPTPHDIIWGALSLKIEGIKREYENPVPDRGFRLDIAVPALKLAIEVDGWQWHGKYLKDFVRDRARQNLLVTNGWKVLRYTAGQIRKNLDECVEQIQLAVKQGTENAAGR